MNKLTKAVLLGATVALASQGAYAQTGDLILGFTGNSATTDTTFNLGVLSSSTISTGTLDAGGLSSFSFSGVFGYVGSGGQPGNGIDLSVARGGTGLIGAQGSESAPTDSSSATFLQGANSAVTGIIIGSGVGSYTGNSYSANTVPANPGVQNNSVFSDNGGNTSLVANGTAMDIFSELIGTAVGHGQPPAVFAYIGQLDLTLGSDSDTYEFIPAGYVTPVPEPATYGMIAGAGLLALALRRQLTAKNA